MSKTIIIQHTANAETGFTDEMVFSAGGQWAKVTRCTNVDSSDRFTVTTFDFNEDEHADHDETPRTLADALYYAATFCGIEP